MTPAPTRSMGQKRAYQSQRRWALEVASLNEEEDDADGDENQGAEDGAAAKAAGLVAVGLSLGAEHVALGTGLLFEHATLILPVVSVWRAAGRTGRGVGWRIVCHGLISLPDRAGWKETMEVPGSGGGAEGGGGGYGYGAATAVL